MIDRANFLEMLNEIRRCVLAANGEIFEFEIGEPASMELVDEIERRYGVPFPADFVYFLTAVAGKVDISWGIYTDDWFKKGQQLPFNCPENGRLYWNAEQYLDSEIYWFTQNPRNLPFLEQKILLSQVGNGDLILFDTAPAGNQKPIVYYSHDADYEGLPQVAGCFENYVNSLLKLGLVGDDFYSLEPFLNMETGGIDPEQPNALAWRKLLGLGLV
ncbi:MAG: SMI1/KNR4 family protein [Lawsonibacter sp.]|jgi:hypothetical protein|nr:SMI1/KNR4 family protein [Lawsonibacter sp.]